MSNPFLTKKDSLVEAVQSAMQDGEYRRQAEAIVNEAFGVYSRKAVIREELADYDAAIEEVYADLKEGKEEVYYTRHKTGHISVSSKPPFEGGRRKAKKDYDKDGKIESPKDEVWGSRLRAARLAGKLKEGWAAIGPTHDFAGDPLPTARYYGRKRPQAPKPGEAEPGAGDTYKGSKQGGKTRLVKKNVKEESQLYEVTKRAAISAYRGKEGEERDTSKLRGLIKRKWGEKTAKHADRAGARDTGNLVRRGESSGTDRLASAKPSSEMRKTKSGKIHKQDVESKKSEMKFRKSMSKFVNEEQIDEVSAFGSAFAAARKAGQSQFSFGGKSYTTAMKGSTGSANKPSTSSASTPLPPNRTAYQPKPVDQAQTIRQSGGTPSVGTGTAHPDTKTAPMPPSRPANLGSPTPTTPGSTSISAQPAPTSGPSGEQKMKTMASLKEEVQVGTNRYRIV